MIKKLIYILSGIALGTVLLSVALAAPVANYVNNLLPARNQTYDLGSTTPAAEWNNIYTKNITISGTCTGCSAPGAGAYPFTPSTNFGSPVSATSSILWAQNGIFASSTSQFVYASTTAITVDNIIQGSATPFIIQAPVQLRLQIDGGTQVFDFTQNLFAPVLDSITDMGTNSNRWHTIFTTYASSTAFTVSGTSYLGTVASGLWNGTTIGTGFGGTGLTTVGASSTALLSNGSTLQFNKLATSQLTNDSGFGVGSVTSVDGSGGTTGLTLTGGAITGSGTLTLGGTLIVANGGTGTTTAPVAQLLYGGSSGVYQSVATSTATCTTGASCTAFTIVGAGGTTISTTLGTSIDLASEVGATVLPIANGGTNASAFTTTGNGVYWDGTSLLTAPLTSAVTYPYASTTAISSANASTTALTVSGIQSALVLTGASGLTAPYTAQACTNQLVRGLSALGAPTCATVGAADVSLANLTATDATLTFSGTYTGATARTIGLNLGNANTWTALQTINYATTTSLSVSSILYATGGTLISASSTVTNTTFDLSTATVKDHVYKTFTYATSTAWTGTSTIQLGTAIVLETWKQAVCRTDVGTLNVTFYNSGAKMNMLSASTASSTAALTTNTALPALTNRKVDIGTPASSPTVLTCTVDIIQNQ